MYVCNVVVWYASKTLITYLIFVFKSMSVIQTTNILSHTSVLFSVSRSQLSVIPYFVSNYDVMADYWED